MAGSREDHITRRDFLARSATIGAGAALTGAFGCAGVEQMAGRIPTVTLGKTGEKVTTLGFGGGVKVTPQLLNATLTEGITYIDTAQGYGGGDSEKAIGEILEVNGRRKECFIVTKSGQHDADSFVSNLEKTSLERLRTDYVDLYCLHNIKDPDRLDSEMKATAERLKASGKIRFFGFSCHDAGMVGAVNRAAEVGFVDAIMIKYNFRTYKEDDLNRAIDRCTEAGIGLIAMKTQGGAVESFQDRVDPFVASGFNKYQAALKAVWTDERMHSVVSSMNTIQKVQENAAAARNKTLTAAERRLLDRYAAETDHLYCRGCADLCEGCVNGPVKIADTLRYRMYHEYYGEHDLASHLFRRLPAAERSIAGVDFAAAEAACPHRLPIGELMRDAAIVLG